MAQLPLSVDAFIDYLADTFPDRAPDLKWDEKRVWFEAGSAAVVRHLRFLQSARDENILTNVSE